MQKYRTEYVDNTCSTYYFGDRQQLRKANDAARKIQANSCGALQEFCLQKVSTDS